MGPSGGGKTTVSRLAARFWDVSRGKITVGGMDISKTDPEALLSLFSIVFQDVTLFDNTILENIRIGNKEASDEQVMAAARLAKDVYKRQSFSWLKSEICKIEQQMAEESGGKKTVYDIINEEIASAPVGSNGVLFLPHLMGERAPRWNPKAKGSFLGITLANTRADLLRAVVEGIALNLNCILTEIRQEIEVNELIMICLLYTSRCV